ncbi:transporter (CPA2 family) [Streptomyces sp. 1114.5]|uniref:cation:proton antiporter n=1 Tax=Streptomyces sp. 1114.5 TaxID=1938830 RepID=UPI000EAC92D1|nr:cation:proton antiporter [Streptomyces sp. 1114.5]RKT17035.1 transporter (CPA2 family) [Streptomyces sp. 1114.5]
MTLAQSTVAAVQTATAHLAAVRTAPQLTSHQVLVFLLQLGVLLLVAFCLGRLANRIGLAPVVGELAAGVLLGPSVFGRIASGAADWLFPARADQAHLLDAVAQLSVLLLVGVAGAHLDLRMLRRRRTVVAKIGLAGLLLPLALGVSAGYVVPAALIGESGHGLVFALFLGVALSVSAIPVIAKTFADMNLLHRDVGQLTLASAAVDDAIGWMLLSLVATMAAGSLGVLHIGLAVATLAGFLLVALVLGRPLVRWAIRRAGGAGQPGPTAVVATVVILFCASATQLLNLEAVFGAFVAGVLLSSVVEHRLLAPLRTVTVSVFAPLFLANAGLRIDLGALLDPSVLLTGVALLVLAVVGKFAGAYLGARTSGLTRWEGLAIGAGLNARGAVEIVVASIGLKLGVLTTATYTVVVLIAVFTSMMAPPVLRRAMARIEQNADERLREAELELAPAARETPSEA